MKHNKPILIDGILTTPHVERGVKNPPLSPTPFSIRVDGPAPRYRILDAQGELIATTYGQPQQAQDAQLFMLAPQMAEVLDLLLRQADACADFRKTFTPQSRETARAILTQLKKV